MFSVIQRPTPNRFSFVPEIIQIAILHIVSTGTVFSVACSTFTKTNVNVRKLLDYYWFNVRGAQKTILGDPEFIKNKFNEALASFKIFLEAKPARLHNKLGVQNCNSLTL